MNIKKTKENQELHEIDEYLYVSITNNCSSTNSDIFILNFSDIDGEGYANYVTSSKLKNLALFILNYLERHKIG